ncbi:threonine/serine dehydratase [Allobacillus sp. GCM10007491]|uniref:threonine ammonia-lyase n=1 Tax=Allobacillus saliphilus TaxID=2912308 RepID=A0A941HTI0_9BACI|nr:threonine/serine dehydratase [Allobacillus saliphilus]MBR7554861.1 threonine/serine dehydratase [Allobacillus saliphilus]
MVSLEDVLRAREQIAETIHKTRILRSSQLSEMTGANMLFKSEHLQKTGSFKIRGATNRVINAEKEGAKYITAASSGNHGQAVAYISNQLGIPATIVVPTDATESKVNAIRNYNGKVEFAGTTSADRIPKAKEIAKDNAGVFIPPYDHPDIVAGQGTVGLEITEQVQDVDVVFVPVGGGGLVAGILTAIKEINPDVKVYGVEPELANDTAVSLQEGKIMTAGNPANTIADGLRTDQPGDLTFPILQKYIDDLIVVKEDDVRFAMSFVYERMKQVIEPSAAVSLTAALKSDVDIKGKTVVNVLSGGNVDLSKLNELLVKTTK